MIEFISGVLERFEITLEKDESINTEIKNYELGIKRPEIFTACSIRAGCLFSLDLPKGSYILVFIIS